jgi:methionine-rich copper-binding protein CopC
MRVRRRYSLTAQYPARIVFLRLLCAWLSLCAFLACSIPSYAHAVLVQAVPGAHSTVAGTSVKVRLQFNVRVDPKRSRVALVLPDKSQKLLSMSQSAPDVLEAQLAGLKDGEYSIRWQVLASDGHITQGEIPFKVTV